MRRVSNLGGKVGLLAMLALGTIPSSAEAQGATPKRAITHKDRKSVSITIYNQNFGLVREVRRARVGQGKVELEFRDVSRSIQPETVAVKSLSGSLDVLEQNYRFDLLTPKKLLEKYVGKRLRLIRFNEKTGKDEPFAAKLLSVAGGTPIYEINGEVTYGFPGRVSFPGVPKNLMAKPTLVWLVNSKKAQQDIEISYLTRNLSWKADYVFVIDAKDRKGDLTGWVTLNNRSGASYKNARLKLVAGDVQRVSDTTRSSRTRYGATGKGEDSRFREESFFEYHLYSLGRPADVLENEQKQVTLLEAKNARTHKQLIYYGKPYWYRGRHGQVQKNQKVGVYLDLKNIKQNGLGMPLPKGTVRVYKADKAGAKQFVGEDNIDHTPRGEKIRIKMGEAFDVIGNRKQMKWRSLGRCNSETEWEIELRNHKDQAERVLIFEPVGGDWNIVRSSHPHKKEDSRTFTFNVQVPARGKTKISYKVRVRWC